MNTLVKKIKYEYTIELLTGLHIGGNSDNVEIGGIDLPVIKLASKNNQPYIPGSSLKGKMRCLLEQSQGALLGKNEKINKVFGWAKKGQRDTMNDEPSQVIFRDAMMTSDSVNLLNSCDLDMPFTEGKWENTIDRCKGTAEHPRQIERVPAGVEFHCEIILNIWADDYGKTNEEEAKLMISDGITLLENDYLGGNGSRGYGQIKFKEENITTVWQK